MSRDDRKGSAGRRGSSLMTASGLVALGYLYFTRRGAEVRETLRRDIEVIRERDPAATGTIEIVTCYSGLHAIMLHRLAHALWVREIPLVPRLISQFSRLVTQIEIHPAATVGEGLFIDHGSGVVIGETTEIGDNVTIYQGVTLGGTGKESGKRHPTIGHNVVIGTGAKVLGSITVGDNAKVGAGSVVVQSVPPNSTVVGNPGRPVITDGEKVGIPDIDYTHLPDPVAQAMHCIVRRMVQMENELDEICPPHQKRRQDEAQGLEDQICNLSGYSQGSGI
jgi:serine O-acetyltransferase